MSCCLECRHLDLKANPGHAKVGLGKCAFEREVGRFVPISTDRDCEKFKRAEDEIVQARAEWWKKINSKRE